MSLAVKSFQLFLEDIREELGITIDVTHESDKFSYTASVEEYFEDFNDDEVIHIKKELNLPWISDSKVIFKVSAISNAGGGFSQEYNGVLEDVSYLSALNETVAVSVALDHGNMLKVDMCHMDSLQATNKGNEDLLIEKLSEKELQIRNRRRNSGISLDPQESQVNTRDTFMQLAMEDDGLSLMSGTMMKLARKSGKNWKARYFVLTSKALAYYEDEKSFNKNMSKSWKGDIPITKTSSVEMCPASLAGFEYGIKLINGDDTIMVAVVNDSEQQTWAKAIQSVIDSKSESYEMKYDSSSDEEKNAMSFRGSEFPFSVSALQHEGYLIKEARQSKRNRKKRYFALVGSRLYYYVDFKSFSAAKSAENFEKSMKGCVRIKADTKVKREGKCVFSIFTPGESVNNNSSIILYADDDSLMKGWITKLNEVVDNFSRKQRLLRETAKNTST